MASGLRGVTLRFAHEVRPEADYFNELPQMKLPAEMMKLAQHIIRTKSAEFDPSMLEDHYRTALVRILQKKQAKAPRATACGRALARERHKPDGCVKAQHRGGKPFTAAAATRGRCKSRVPQGPATPAAAAHKAFRHYSFIYLDRNLDFFRAKWQGSIRHVTPVVSLVCTCEMGWFTRDRC